MTERTDLTTYWEEGPRLIEVADTSSEITIQDLHDTLKSNTQQASENDDSLDNMDDDPLIDSAGKEDLGGGVSVGITSTLQYSQVAFQSRLTPTSSGTVTTQDTGGTILIDNIATFEADLVTRGAVVINFSDESITEVLEVVSETQLRCRVLRAGNGNTFEIGDDYKIWNIVQCNIAGGNLVAVDDVDATISPVFPTAFTQVVRTSSSSATISGLTGVEDDLAEVLLNTQTLIYGNQVHIDVNDGAAGTAFPVGTVDTPSNNLADALVIAAGRNIEILHVTGDLTIGATENIDGYTMQGHQAQKTQITLTAGCSTDQSQFIEVTITGTADGPIIIRESLISDFAGFSGIAFQCAISGYIRPIGAQPSLILQCYAEAPEVHSEIDMSTSQGGIAIRDWNGPIKFTNSTGGHPICLDYNSSRIVVDSTVTTGNVHITGSGGLVDDQSNGTAVVNVDGAMTTDLMKDVYTAMGFNIDETVTITPTGLDSSGGSVSVVFTGDGVTSTTMTRQP
jgi:hypothetical protein